MDRLSLLFRALVFAILCPFFVLALQFSVPKQVVAADQTIKIGIDLPLSGAESAVGGPTRNGAVLAIEQAAAHGLPGGFHLVAYDLDDSVQGKHDPAQGAQNAKTFVADASVLGMLGPFNSNVAKAQIPITNDAGLVQISPAATSDTLTMGAEAARLRSSHPETIAFFRINTTDSRQGAAAAKFAHKLGYKRAFVIDDNETYGADLSGVFEVDFKAVGGLILGHEHITPNQVDFKALLTKVRSSSPDLVFFGGTTSTGGGLIRRQMADAGLRKVAFFGGDGIGDDEFLRTTGASGEGTYFTVAAPDVHVPAVASFVAAYRARFHIEPDPYSANAYAAAQVLIDAIVKALRANGGKMPARADVLSNVAHTKNFATPVGRIGFDQNGDTTNPILTLYGVKNSRPVFISQTTLANGH